MGVIKFIGRILGWLVTILLQVAVSYLIIYILWVIFSGVDTASRLGWLASLFAIWLGYVVGINLVGQLALRFIWNGAKVLPRQRLVGTAVGAFIPLLILLVIGLSLPVGDEGTRFYDLVINTWQPILTQASLFAAIVGYFVPGYLNLQTQTALAG